MSFSSFKEWQDDQCFKWSVTRALNFKEIPTVKELRHLGKESGTEGLLKQNPHRIDKKLQEQAEELNWNGINFPASWKDIDVTNGGVKSAQTPPCDILFFSVCLESPENQVTQTPFRIKRKI